MSKKTYWQKLKDPRWQKKRLEALAFNEFSCELCGSKESELHVHHKEYFKEYDPWEYDIKQLSVLCDECHESYHLSFDELKWVCSLAELDGPMGRKDAALVLAGFLNVDYSGFLTISCLPDLEHHRKLYNCGVTSYNVANGIIGDEK